MSHPNPLAAPVALPERRSCNPPCQPRTRLPSGSRPDSGTTDLSELPPLLTPRAVPITIDPIGDALGPARTVLTTPLHRLRNPEHGAPLRRALGGLGGAGAGDEEQ